MDLPNLRIIDIAKKRTHPYISLGERFPIDNLSAKLSFELEGTEISAFIIDFSSGNIRYKYDFDRLIQNIQHIVSISFSDSYIFNQFVKNYYSSYQLNKKLNIKIMVDRYYQLPIRLEGKKLKQLKFVVLPN